MQTGVKNGQSLYDVLLSIGYPLEYAVQFVQGAGIDNLDFDFEQTPNLSLYFNPELAGSLPIALGKTATANIPTTATQKAIYGQTIYDICLMTTGRLEDAVKLALAANFDSPNQLPQPNDLFTFAINEISDTQFYNKVKNQYKYFVSIDPENAIVNALSTETLILISTEDGRLILV